MITLTAGYLGGILKKKNVFGFFLEWKKSQVTTK